jgi:hypothetical protein
MSVLLFEMSSPRNDADNFRDLVDLGPVHLQLVTRVLASLDSVIPDGEPFCTMANGPLMLLLRGFEA